MQKKGKSPRELVYFPIVYNALGLVIVFVLYVASPGHTVAPETLNGALYLGVVATHWLLFFVTAKKLKLEGVRDLIAPKSRLRWPPSIIVFISLNTLFTTYMILALRHGRIPAWGNQSLLQLVFYLVVNPLTAGFVEELIWRGHFIEKLLAMGKTEQRAVIYSSVSFAFIHGVMLPDKLAVTFLFGLIAGTYYVRERNLPVLMVSHVVLDVVAFGLSIFRPI